ncbi:MAG TPA: serine/threonine-protein kinase [Nannocystaceae bacterium]|nr:serine/threonine-protein kinase [Nannocystaceae bacterium]
MVTSLGAGGTAQVYLALLDRGAGLGQLVVLKTLLPHLAGEPAVVQMFRNEAGLAARLEHPNVVEVHEVIEDDGRPVIVMEYLRGASLQELLRRSVVDRFPLAHHLEVLRRTCEGLHYCHELRDFDGTPMGLVHRDVSPHNIFLTFAGETKLLDFGIAKVAGADGGTGTGVLKGKIRYMAPEQMMGDQVDRHADIYAIGVLLWEAVSGREMWAGMNDAMILQRVVAGELPPPDPLPECPAELVTVVERCLAMNPHERWSSCAELSEAIAAMIRMLPAEHRSIGACVTAAFDDRDVGIASLVQAAAAAPWDLDHGSVDWLDARLISRRTISRTHSNLPPLSEPRPRARWPWLVVASAIAAATIGWIARTWNPPAPPEPEPPSATVPQIQIVSVPAAEPTKAPATVEPSAAPKARTTKKKRVNARTDRRRTRP